MIRDALYMIVLWGSSNKEFPQDSRNFTKLSKFSNVESKAKMLYSQTPYQRLGFASIVLVVILSSGCIHQGYPDFQQQIDAAVVRQLFEPLYFGQRELVKRLGNDVDESTDYKRSNPTPQDFKSAAATLYDWTRPNATPDENCPPSYSTR